jgi:HNH endonuclease
MPRCFYCAQPFEGSQDEEHVLPAAIGADLVTGKVCTACNRRAGVEVDQPWLRHPEVVELRGLYSIADRRGRVRPASWEGQLNSGKPATISLKGDEVRIVRRPTEEFDGSVWTLEGYDEDAAKRKLERIRAKYGDVRPISSEERMPDGPLTAHVTHVVDVGIWPRFAAKVALGVASLLVDDDSWLSGPIASVLRSVLWSGHPSTLTDGLAHPGVAWSLRPFELQPGTHPLRAPEHLLIFEETPEEGEWLVIVVFGWLPYRVPLAMDWAAIEEPPQSWRIDPIAGRHRRLPAAEQVALLGQSLTDG